MRVILIKGRSTYDLLRAFIDDAATGFIEAGCQAEILDVVAEPDVAAGLAHRKARGPIDLVYSLNILSDFRDPAGRAPGDIAGAPHVVHFVDYPLSHLNRLEKTPANAAVLVIDPSHAEALLSIYGPDRFGFVGFCPHAAVGPTTAPGRDADAFVAARPIPILFPGTCPAAGTAPWAHLQPGVQSLFEAATEIALASEWTPGLAALDAAMRAAGLSPEDPEFAGFRKLASYVHEWVRLLRRLRLLEAAARAGLRLQVAGKGYAAALTRYANLTFLGDVDFLGSVALMSQSRLVLNVNANFGAGSHEAAPVRAERRRGDGLGFQHLLRGRVRGGARHDALPLARPGCGAGRRRGPRRGPAGHVRHGGRRPGQGAGGAPVETPGPDHPRGGGPGASAGLTRTLSFRRCARNERGLAVCSARNNASHNKMLRCRISVAVSVNRPYTQSKAAKAVWKRSG